MYLVCSRGNACPRVPLDKVNSQHEDLVKICVGQTLLLASRNFEQPTVSPERVQVEPCAKNDDISHRNYQEYGIMS